MLKQKILKSMYPGATAAGERFGRAWLGMLAVFIDPSQENLRAGAVAELRAALPDYLEAAREKPRDPDEWIISRLRAALNNPASDSEELNRALVAGLLATWSSSPRAVEMAPDIAAWAATASADC